MAETATVVGMSIYLIPAANLGGLEAKIAKLAKRADKLGVPAPTIAVGAAIDIAERTDAGIETGRTIRHYEVEVTGESPRYDGWHLTAVIEMDPEEGRADGGPGQPSPNVVGVVPGAPEAEVHVAEWRLLDERCDHCGVGRRNRKKLVVVTHEDGSQKVVGSTCLKDFLGSTSPDAIAHWAQFLADLDDMVGEFTEPGTGGEFRYDPITYLAWVARAITEFGWVSRSAAYHGTATATADVAIEMWNKFNKQGLARTIDPLTEAEVARATEAWEWAATVGGNDYLDNVSAVAQKLSLRHNHLGIAASIISAFDRERGRVAERAARAAAMADSQFVGKPKERVDVAGEVVLVREFPSHYGYDAPPKALVKVVTDEGNLIVWWCSNATKAPAQGDRVSGKATVKEHSLYEGVKQTTVLRAKLDVLVAS